MPLTDIGVGKYNMARAQTYGSDVSGAANGAVTSIERHAGSHTVDDPMMWLVGIGAVTLGLVAFSTSLRVGKVSASLSAG